MIRYNKINSKSSINALNLIGKISIKMACQNTINASIIASKNQKKPPKKGLGLLYIKSPSILYETIEKYVK